MGKHSAASDPDEDELARRRDEAARDAADNHGLGVDGDEASHADQRSGLAPDSDSVRAPDGAVQDPPD